MAGYTDIAVYETGQGGDAILRNNDIVGTTGYENSIYLALFGGYDWWGNTFTPEANQFNSKTCKVLGEVAINSSGRIAIERAVMADLAFLDNIPNTNYSATVTIIGINRIRIKIIVNGKEFSLLWHPDSILIDNTLTL